MWAAEERSAERVAARPTPTRTVCRMSYVRCVDGSLNRIMRLGASALFSSLACDRRSYVEHNDTCLLVELLHFSTLPMYQARVPVRTVGARRHT